MRPWSLLLPAFVLAAPATASVAEEAFVCNVGALTAAQRERHQALGRMLQSAAVERAELENGYMFVLDLGRLPLDSAGAPFCVVEVAEWVDLVVASAPQVRAAARSLSPGHRRLAVAYFGTEDSVRELETFEPERVCREGLGWLDEESSRRNGKGFFKSEPADQAALLQTISDARADKSVVTAGTRLFDFLKAESIRGFYTSRLGLKELDYKGNAFYGTSPGCGLAP